MTRTLRPYPQYRPSGVSWLGDIPAHWSVKKLKYLTKGPLQYGANEAAEITDLRLPRFVRITDIASNGGLRDDTFCSLPEDVAAPFLLHSGDILFARSGATVGKTFMYNESWGRCCFAGYLIRARVDADLALTEFVNYFANSGTYWDWISSINVQSTIQNVSADKYANLSLGVPPLEEQQEIAAYLDRETRKIDELISRKERFLTLLAEKRSALISHAVTRGLNPDAPTKESGVEWLGEIPAHWEVSRLDMQCSVKARLGWKALTASEYVDEGFIFLSTPNIKSKEIDFVNVDHITAERYYESPEIMLEQEDILLVKDGATLGIVNIVRHLPEPATVNGSTAVIRPKKPIDNLYLFYFLLADYTQNVIQVKKGGMGVPHLFQSDIKKFILLLPPLEEQKRISAFLDMETSKIDRLTEKTRQHIARLQERRSALISAAVTGKIDVRSSE